MKSSDLLDKNRALFQKMKEMAVEQEKLISEEHVDDFLAILSKRERLQREISHNNKKIERENRLKLTGEAFDSISMEIADIIKNIQEVDQKINGILLDRKDNLVVNIKNFRKAKKALKGYGAKKTLDPRFIDKSG